MQQPQPHGGPGLPHPVGTRKVGVPWKIDWPVTLVRFAVAVLLLTSAILKAFSPAESATLAAGYSIPPWLTAAAVQLELLVAAALVFGCWQWWTLRLTIGLFSIFAAFSLYRAVAGFESCGCFGAIKVNPWITFVLDLVVLGCLGFAAKRSGKADQPREDARQVRWAAAAYVFAGPPILALMLWTGPTTLGSNGALVQSGELVILDPEGWINKEFPLTAYLSPEVDVTRGDWTVFIYHHDCPKCQEAIPKYLALAERLSSQGSGERVLFLEVPPYGAALPRRRSVHYLALRDEHEWFVQAPVEIVLTNGIVTGASLELPRIGADQMVFSR